MDLEAKIKEEPAWLEGTTTASLENFEHVSEVIAVKEEVKSELTEPGSSQDNPLEPSEDTKEEIFIEEHTDDQLLPYIKEETKSRPEVSYRDHQPPDGGSPSFRCSVCSEFLAGKMDHLRHQKRHKDDGPFKCDHCGKVFGSRSSLSEHLRIHPLQVCGFSDKCFTERKILTGGTRLQTSVIINECSVCYKNFRNSPDIMRTHTGEKSYCCTVCGKSFSRKKILAGHMRIHMSVKPHSCTVCGKSFIKKSGLSYHMLIHTGEKPYSCSDCGKSFVQKGSLTDHTRTHTGEKPYICNVCGVFFSRKSYHAIHILSHTDENPYKCNVCGKSFIQKGTLTNHMRTHTGEKPYTCNVCGVSFSRKAYHANHVRTHTGEKLYKCNVCGKSFIQKGTLTNHMRVHTGEKPFSCNVCGESFSRKVYLAIHILSHTG